MTSCLRARRSRLGVWSPWLDGSRCNVVAMVCHDHGERDLAIGGGVEGTFRGGGDLDFVADAATITAAVEDKRMIGQHG